MAVFSTSTDVIQEPAQAVTVNGSLRREMRCVSIDYGTGISGSIAQFEFPSYLFDEYKDDLRDGEVRVSVASGGADFIGYLDVDTAQLSTGADSFTMQAKSITQFLSKVWIGQSENIPVLEAYLKDPVTLEDTGFTPAEILKELFRRLPDKIRSRIALGDTTVLDTTSQNSKPVMAFRNMSYSAAIESVLEMFGDVTFYERFTDRCVLHFFRIQDSNQPLATARVAGWRNLDGGVNVEDLTSTQNIESSITQINGYGAPKRFVVTLTNYDLNPEKRLIKGWDSELEAAVLSDPKRATPGSKGYVPGMEHVFRRYLLPRCLSQYVALKSLGVPNPVTSAAGSESDYEAQCFKLPTILEEDPEGGLTGVESTTPALIKNVRWSLEEGFVQIGKCVDALNIVRVEIGNLDGKANVPVYTWEPAKLSITIAIEHKRTYLNYVGTNNGSGIRLPFIDDGLSEQIQLDDLRYVQFTNVDHPVYGPSGSPLEFAATYYSEYHKDWVTYEEPLVVHDDTETLQRIITDMLKAKNKRHRSVSMRVPYFTRAYMPGKRLQIRGMRNDAPGTLMITGCNWDLVNNTTQVVADNIRPPRRSTLRTSGSAHD